MTCIDAITKLFEVVVAIVQDESPQVEQHFGKGSTMTILRHLQQQCDVHSTMILSMFQEEFQISRVVRDLFVLCSGGSQTTN